MPVCYIMILSECHTLSVNLQSKWRNIITIVNCLQDSEGLVEEENYVPAIAIVGRPNVGKSSILNALVGENRTIVSPVSGTTRDAIDTEFTGPDGQVWPA